MRMNVNGNGNRVAGGNYYENQSKPCCKCETRFVVSTRTVCNHCLHQEQVEKNKSLAMILLAAFFFVFVNLHQWREERGTPPGLEGLVESAILTIGVLGFGCVALWLIKDWLSNRW